MQQQIFTPREAEVQKLRQKEIERQTYKAAEQSPLVSHTITSDVTPESPRIPPLSVEMNRRKLLQWIGWGGAGVGADVNR